MLRSEYVVWSEMALAAQFTQFLSVFWHNDNLIMKQPLLSYLADHLHWSWKWLYLYVLRSNTILIYCIGMNCIIFLYPLIVSDLWDSTVAPCVNLTSLFAPITFLHSTLILFLPNFMRETMFCAIWELIIGCIYKIEWIHETLLSELELSSVPEMVWPPHFYTSTFLQCQETDGFSTLL